MDLTQTFPLQYNALESFGDFMQEDKNIFYSPNSHKCVYPRNIILPQPIIGTTGPRGHTGATGKSGDRGPTGADGLKGDTGVAGPMGPIGKTGPTGATGETGERGPSGENLEARSTTTIDCHEPAKVTAYHDGNTTFLDFFIPRGETGKSETLLAGKTIQTSPDQEAGVIDRFENDQHFLDFIIPQGQKGESGEKGETGERGPQGIQGEKGDQGEKGEKGDTGPRGATAEIATNANFYNPDSQSISNGNRIALSNELVNNGITLQNNQVLVPANGTYLVLYSFNNATYATTGENISIAINSVIQESTRRPLTRATSTFSATLLNLKANDMLSLVPTVSSSQTLTNSSSPSVSLTIIRLT